MKRILFIVVFVVVHLFANAQNYYRQYPVSAQIDSLNSKYRVSFSVFDSVLGNVQYYKTPYYEYLPSIENNNGGVVAFLSQGPTTDKVFYGFVNYDHIYHQFVADLHTGDPANNPMVGVHAEDIGFEYYMEDAWTGYGYSILKKYDLIAHDFVITGSCYDINCGITFFYPWTGTIHSYDWLDNDGSIEIFDPAIHMLKYSGVGCDWGVDIQDDYCGTHSSICESDGFRAYNPLMHQWKSPALNTGSSYGTMEHGIFHTIDVLFDKSHFGFYDGYLNTWLFETLPHTFNSTVIAKNRLFAFLDNTPTGLKVYMYAHNASTHTLEVDSASLAGGGGGLTITNSTVSWVDTSGTYVRGYSDSTGWVNTAMTIQPDFHITNLFPSTSEPLIHVRNHTIGTDSVYYDFGDGVISLDNTHVMWHLYEGAGPYEVCIYDMSGTFVSCQTVSFPCVSTYSITNSCHGFCTGSISVNPPASGLPYTILWSNGATTSMIDSLCPGVYSYTITDSLGCHSKNTLKINTPQLVTEPSVACYDICNSSIGVYFNNSPAPLNYLWNTGATTDNLTNLCPGNYTVTVTDANQCIQTATATIPDSLDIATSFTAPPCYCCNGCGIATGIGGTTPYSYYWVALWDSSNSVCVEPAIYEVHVIDADGCRDTGYVDILPWPPMSIVTSNQNPSCIGCNDGYIAINSISNGTPPYTITWYPNVGMISGDTIYNLPAGPYMIRIYDDDGCDERFYDTLTAFVGEVEFLIENQFSLHPNPANEYIIVTFENYTNRSYSLEIQNTIGEIVVNKEYFPGKTEHKIDIKSLLPGIYYVSILSDGIKSKTLKLVKY